jgi:hypothetical protein
MYLCPCLSQEILTSDSIFIELVQCVEVGAIANNIITILLKCITKNGKVLDEEFGSRWVCLGCDGNYVFQGHHIKVIL